MSMLPTSSRNTGITASLSTTPVAINGTSTLTVQVASSVAPGTYPVTVNGMSGSQAGVSGERVDESLLLADGLVDRTHNLTDAERPIP